MASMPELKFANNRLLREVVSHVRCIVNDTVGAKASFAEREEVALAVANESVRKMLEGDLQERASCLGHAKELFVEGVLYRRHEEGKVAYHSLTGALNVCRHTYRLVGKHNGPTVVPLELEAGLVEGATPALAFSVAQGYGKHDMRSHREDLETAHRIPPSRTALEDMAKRIGQPI